MNMTEAQKLSLLALTNAGASVQLLAYDPSTVQGNPETSMTSNGWVQFLREASATKIEVIYIKGKTW